MQSIATETGAQRRQNGNAAGDGRSKLKLAALRTRQLQQVRAMTSDELLVRRHHRLACAQGATHQIFGGMKAADQLNDDVGVGVENGLEVLGPNDVVRHPGLLLSFEVAIADLRQAEQAISTLTENLGHGAAHGSEAHQRDATWGSRTPWHECWVGVR